MCVLLIVRTMHRLRYYTVRLGNNTQRWSFAHLEAKQRISVYFAVRVATSYMLLNIYLHLHKHLNLHTTNLLYSRIWRLRIAVYNSYRTVVPQTFGTLHIFGHTLQHISDMFALFRLPVFRNRYSRHWIPSSITSVYTLQATKRRIACDRGSKRLDGRCVSLLRRRGRPHSCRQRRLPFHLQRDGIRFQCMRHQT